ncbi:MAG TPA: hypothetical protein EYO94_12180, partial [Acidobacteria bacterium]|nr:hypothetical protein [Acidobacteriota bacterium]
MHLSVERKGIMLNRLFFLAVTILAVAVLGAIVSAQNDGHISAVVNKLSRGERVYGVSTYDLSLE